MKQSPISTRVALAIALVYSEYSPSMFPNGDFILHLPHRVPLAMLAGCVSGNLKWNVNWNSTMAETEPFKFDSDSTEGYDRWQREQAERVKAISREWGLPINRPVSLKLKDFDRSLEGTLRLAAHPARIDRQTPLQLQIGDVAFSSLDIEECVRTDR